MIAFKSANYLMKATPAPDRAKSHWAACCGLSTNQSPHHVPMASSTTRVVIGSGFSPAPSYRWCAPASASLLRRPLQPLINLAQLVQHPAQTQEDRQQRQHNDAQTDLHHHHQRA